MYTNRPSRGSHVLWIIDSSEEVAQCQLQTGFDIDLHQNLDIYLIHRNKHKEAAKKGRLRNRSQVKEQENSPELEEIETSSLSNTEFRVMIIRILNSMKRGIETLKKRTSQI